MDLVNCAMSEAKRDEREEKVKEFMKKKEDDFRRGCYEDKNPEGMES